MIRTTNRLCQQVGMWCESSSTKRARALLLQADQLCQQEGKIHWTWRVLADATLSILQHPTGSLYNLRSQLKSLSNTTDLNSQAVRTFLQTVAQALRSIDPHVTDQQIAKTTIALLRTVSDRGHPLIQHIKQHYNINTGDRYGKKMQMAAIATVIIAASLYGCSWLLSIDTQPAPLPKQPEAISNAANNLNSTTHPIAWISVLMALSTVGWAFLRRNHDALPKDPIPKSKPLFEYPIDSIASYGFGSCFYSTLALEPFKGLMQYGPKLGLIIEATEEGNSSYGPCNTMRPDNTTPMHKIFVQNYRTTQRYCKAGLVNLILDNFLKSQQGLPITPCLVCIAFDGHPCNTETLLTDKSFTAREIRRMYTLLYDTRIPKEMRDMAQRTFHFVKVNDQIITSTPQESLDRDKCFELLQAPWANEEKKWTEFMDKKLSKDTSISQSLWRLQVQSFYILHKTTPKTEEDNATLLQTIEKLLSSADFTKYLPTAKQVLSTLVLKIVKGCADGISNSSLKEQADRAISDWSSLNLA